MKATIGQDGSLRLPAAARARLGLDPGTVVRLELETDRIVIRRAQPVAARPAHEVQVATDPLLLVRRDEAGEPYAALSYERRVHE